MKPFIAAFGEDLIRGRKFIVSENNRIGWTVVGARQGDLICTFYGCRIPFVIRPKGSGYELIGDCFLYGLMDGETSELDFESQVITLL